MAVRTLDKWEPKWIKLFPFRSTRPVGPVTGPGLGTSKQETKHTDGVIPHRLKSPSAWASLQLHTWSSEALSRLPLRLGFQERPYPSFWWPLSLRSGLHSPLGSEIHRHYYISNIGEGLDRAFWCILQQLWSNLVWMDAWCSQTPARPRWASLWQ